MAKVLIFTSREGHLSIAQSCQEAFKKAGFNVDVADFWSQNQKFNAYLPFYRYFPFLFKIPYKIGEQKKIAQATKKVAEKWLEKDIKQEIKTSQPDLIVSTNPFYNPALDKILDYQKIPIPFINIITNPWTIHPLELSSIGINLFYDQKGIKFGRKNQLAAEKMAALGWLVRSKFYQPQPLAKIREKLGFKKDIFTILVCGGSEGSNMVLKIIPALLAVKKPVQIMVVCGTNKTLFKALSSFKKFLPKLAKTKINHLETLPYKLNLKLFRFTKNLAPLISVADLVVGKAGPNLIFESIALEKPFLAICHISGQEDANLDLIRKKRLGLVEENSIKTIKLLNKIIHQPKILKKFAPFISREKQNNFQAQERLVKISRQLIY